MPMRLCAPSASSRPTRAATILLCCALLLALAIPARAAMDKVTLYPDGGMVEETVQATLEIVDQRPAVRFSLPAQADPDTLVIVPPEGRGLSDVSWQRAGQSDPDRVRDLERQLDEARQTLYEAEGTLLGINQEIAFWQKVVLPENASTNEAREMASAVGGQVRSLHAALYTAERDQREAQRRVRELEQQLEVATGGTRQLVQVTAFLTGDVPTTSAGGDDLALQVSYVLGGCGWRPVYRVNALPEQGQVEIGFAAEVWQSTGADWQVELALASTQPRRGTRPPSLPEWVIGPAPEPMPLPAPMARTMNMDMRQESAVAAAPKPVRMSTYTLWPMGQRRIPAGPATRLEVQNLTRPASFSRLIRPALSPLAYLWAELDLQETVDLPPGQASYLVEGALVSRDSFALQSSQQELAFGTDPLVHAEVQTLARASGEKGIINKRQTYVWRWRIDIDNAHPTPVTVRLEEPLPRVGDERIEVSLEFDPTPAQQDDYTAVWQVDVPANGQSTITWGVTLSAPPDLKLDKGWR